MTVGQHDATALVSACAWPAEAFWRILELDAVRGHLTDAGSILEIGCGDGMFTALTGQRIDLGLDREANAVARAGRRVDTYRSVRQADLLRLDPFDLGTYSTVFSNSVLEHIPGVEKALPIVRNLLEPSGRLITTVPLREMNEHLAWRSPRYAAWRQRQLEHRTLWSADEWRQHLLAAGFASVEVFSYLDGSSCRFWDRLDVIGALGVGRYRIAPALHKLARVLLPEPFKKTVRRRIVNHLLGRTQQPAQGAFCAAVVVARKPS